MRETFVMDGYKPQQVTNMSYRQSLNMEFIERKVEEREVRQSRRKRERE